MWNIRWISNFISIYYTVKSSLEIQRDEYRKRDEEIKSEKNQKDKEARVAFAGEIAIIVSKFLVSETNYYYLKYNRSDAIECINILEIKLGDINEARSLLLKIKEFHNSTLKRNEDEAEFEWIERSNDEIKNECIKFLKIYVK